MYKELSFGQIVLSSAGHDAGRYYIVIDEDKEYVYLVDGKYKTMSSPKKKNKKHIQILKYVDSGIILKNNDGTLADEDFWKTIKDFENRNKINQKETDYNNGNAKEQNGRDTVSNEENKKDAEDSKEPFDEKKETEADGLIESLKESLEDAIESLIDGSEDKS